MELQDFVFLQFIESILDIYILYGPAKHKLKEETYLILKMAIRMAKIQTKPIKLSTAVSAVYICRPINIMFLNSFLSVK